MTRSFAFSQSVFRLRAVAVPGNRIFTMTTANVCLKVLTEICHPDRTAAKWRDLLFMWVSNHARVAIMPLFFGDRPLAFSAVVSFASRSVSYPSTERCKRNAGIFQGFTGAVQSKNLWLQNPLVEITDSLFVEHEADLYLRRCFFLPRSFPVNQATFLGTAPAAPGIWSATSQPKPFSNLREVNLCVD
jgi:hypothetical protein